MRLTLYTMPASTNHCMACSKSLAQVLFSQRQKVVLTLAIRFVAYFVQLRIAKVKRLHKPWTSSTYLLSGTDLPIKSQDYIHAFFQQNAGKEFVGFWQDAAHQRDLERKVFRYYFFTKRLKDKEHLLHGITALIRNLILAVQKISHYRRKQTFEFKKGGNWISITENAVKYLLQYKEIVLNRMKYTLCADEIFIQTILWNSPFRERMHCTNNANTGSMREIDWEHGSPYIWQDHDYQTLINSNKIFARKFNSNQMGVVYKIQKLYLKQVPK